jgi:SAM-dependent methyltransferase
MNTEHKPLSCCPDTAPVPGEYDTFGAELYDLLAPAFSPTIAGDVEFYVGLAHSAGGPVLDLGCGTGRILIPIAEEGVRVVGLDYSPDMLDVARRKLARCSVETRERVELVQGDMRTFSLGRSFPLIICPFRAFQHLLTSEDQRKALRCIRDHLDEGGRLAFNIFDPSLEFIAAHQGPLGSALKKIAEFTHPDNGRRVVVWDSCRYDLAQQLFDAYWIYEELDKAGHVVQRIYRRLAGRYVFRFEMEYLLELCGFRVEALHGDFHGGPHRHGAEQVWVVSKRLPG